MHSPIPITYWIQKANDAFTDRMIEIFDAEGVTSADWHVLNILDAANAASLE